MAKQKKAALCFFGQARTLKRCYPYIKKSILDPLGKPKKDYDVFCCVEDDEDAKNVELLNPIKVVKIKSSEAKEVFKKDLTFLRDNNYKRFVCRIGPRTPDPFLNMMQQIYKKKLVYNLLENHMKETNTDYKYFVRARFDIVPVEEINIQKINLAKDDLVVPKNDSIKIHDGIDDCFSVSYDLHTFGIYCGVIDNIKKLVLERHSLKLTGFKKIYFLFEKRFKNTIIRFFGKSKHINTIFSLLTMLPDGIFFKSIRNKLVGNHTLLKYQMEKNGKKIKEEKMNYAIIRKNYEGILRIEE